jgi:plastocyanin
MLRRAGLALAVVLGVAACGSGSSTTSSSSSPSSSSGAGAAGTELTIQNFMFSPNPLHANVGATITVTNRDGTNHTVTADDNSFDTKPFSSGSNTFTVNKSGTIKFHCDIHNYMTGEIDVS